MNNLIAADSPSPQMGFEFSHSKVAAAAVNKLGATSIADLDLSNPTRIAAGDALSRMVVDDRVLNMGMTTWRALLDRAIYLGHTELYPSEDGRMGLRKPGLRFGPIHRLPELGPEYVKSSVFLMRVRKALAAGLELKSARVTVKETLKLDLVVQISTFQISLYVGRKQTCVFDLDLGSFPISLDGERMDWANLGLDMALAAALPEADPRLVSHALGTAAAQIVKLIGGLQ